VELIETHVFTRQITSMLSGEEYRDFQLQLLADPASGRIIPGSGGIRKIRIALQGRGRRGGGRVLYYWLVRTNMLILLFAYAKNETEDLTRRQLAELAKYIRRELGHEGTVV
jgi:hypothetical protein